MKKALLILALTISIQTINAHPNAAAHAHETLLHEWAWILIPAIAVVVLIRKFGKKNILNTNKSK